LFKVLSDIPKDVLSKAAKNIGEDSSLAERRSITKKLKYTARTVVGFPAIELKRTKVSIISNGSVT
jgi:hypothetical protein